MDSETEVLKMRLYAYIVDLFLMFLFFAISLIPVTIVLGILISSETDFSNILNFTIFFGLYIFAWIYFALNEKMISTTLGKKLCDLKTIEYFDSEEKDYNPDTDSKISVRQALIRSLLKMRPEILIFDCLGFYIKYGKYQRISESMSNTKVIYADAISGFTKQQQKVFRVYRKVFLILGIFIILLMLFQDVMFLIDILIPLLL